MTHSFPYNIVLENITCSLTFISIATVTPDADYVLLGISYIFALRGHLETSYGPLSRHTLIRGQIGCFSPLIRVLI